MLFKSPELTEHELVVVEQIEDLKQRLRHVVTQSPKRWEGLLRRNTLARNIRGSNSIEGYNVSLDDAVAAVAGEEPLEATSQNWSAVMAYRRAMTYVLQLADDPHFSYSADLIRGLHFMMIEYDLPKWPGKWRLGPIYVHDQVKGEVVYEGPDYAIVPNLIDELIATLNDEDEQVPAVVRGAMGHLNLVMIHPFKDGNGRMARCLQTLILARGGTLAPPFSSIEEWLGKYTQEYYDVLATVGQGSWHPRNDARPWVRFCLKAHFQQATRLLQRSREIEQLWGAAEVEVLKAGLPERATMAVVEAALGARVRNATYRTATDISDQLASRDLKALVDAGLLVAHGERRGRYYKASDRVAEIRRRTKEPRVDVDPFADEHVNQLTLPTVG